MHQRRGNGGDPIEGLIAAPVGRARPGRGDLGVQVWGGDMVGAHPQPPAQGPGQAAFLRLPFVKQRAAPGRQESWVIYCFIS